ncbi:MAG: hypothetical protein J2P48_07590, partial [Alphaproteobacteria bacterium]|nr:hypothetical protein [Alphaproteobacteria bacterium]
MPKKENPELLPLADEIYRFTFNEKSMSSRRAPPGALAAQRRYRPKLRDARRFILDDDAVRLISRLSHERDRFDAWAFLARLPHDPMWLEFNLHTKVQELNTLQKHPPPFIPTEVPRRLGFLLYNDDDNVRWVCHEFYDFTNTHAAGMEHRFNYQPGMLDYVFDPEGDLDTVLRGSKVWKTKTLSQLDWFPKIPLRIACPHDGSPLVEGTIDPEICLCGVFDLVEEVAGQRDPKTGVIRAENFLKPPDWFASRAAV